MQEQALVLDLLVFVFRFVMTRRLIKNVFRPSSIGPYSEGDQNFFSSLLTRPCPYVFIAKLLY